MPEQKIQNSNLITPDIIFEDKDLLVLNKPSGWIVNDALTANAPTIQEWISDNLKFDISHSQLLRSGIVHRLDKETSGCLIVAKTEENFYKLQSQFGSRSVHKTYVALVHGVIGEKKGVINQTVGRLPRGGKFGVIPGGRDALTNYEVLSEFTADKESFSLVKLTPETGRTHQIRIHMKFINHALVADPLYAGRKTARKDRKWCPRLFLHASSITFTHPTSAKSITAESPLPADLEQVLQSFSR